VLRGYGAASFYSTDSDQNERKSLVEKHTNFYPCFRITHVTYRKSSKHSEPGFFQRHFRDPIRVPRNENRVPRIRKLSLGP